VDTFCYLSELLYLGKNNLYIKRVYSYLILSGVSDCSQLSNPFKSMPVSGSS
jgi:hypothetical protein